MSEKEWQVKCTKGTGRQSTKFKIIKEIVVPGKFQRVFSPKNVKGKLFWSYLLNSRP
jgi:hypothetical protein